MPETLAQTTKKRLALIYAVGIAIFVGLFGLITLLALFLAHLK